jgi:hypothetical protein
VIDNFILGREGGLLTSQMKPRRISKSCGAVFLQLDPETYADSMTIE